MVLEPRVPPYARETIAEFLRSHVEESGARGVVLGLSGGIDSALVAKLACDSLGREMVTGLFLPDSMVTTTRRNWIASYARDLGVRFREISIGPLEEAFLHALPQARRDRVMRGNLKSRIRMTILYAEARASTLLVVGTGNKSEILLGYFTKYGDGGADLLPIGDLYKTALFTLGREMGLPEIVLARKPSADLWEGQTDEGELGFTYDFADRVLVGLERLLEPEEIAERLGVPLKRVECVVERVWENRHKRRLPPIPKLSHRTVGVDWRD